MSEENIQPTYKPRKRAKIKRAKINFNKCPECKTSKEHNVKVVQMIVLYVIILMVFVKNVQVDLD